MKTIYSAFAAVIFFILNIFFSQTVIAEDTATSEKQPENQYEKGLDAYYASDYVAAKKLIAPLASKGEPPALNLLGMMYELGKGVPQDAKKSVVYYREAADKGYSYAQYNLAVSYDTGNGIPLNYREAVKWYQRAADQGASFAQYNLGVMFEEGRGTRKDFKKAAYWYRKAALQGHKQAQNNLAWLYKKGQGLKLDPVSAYVWFELAAEQGMVSAKQEGDLIRRHFDNNDLLKVNNTENEIKKAISENTISKSTK